MDTLSGALLLIVYLVCVVIYIYQFKYIKQYGLSILGIFLGMEVVFISLTAVIYYFALPNRELHESTAMSHNIVSIFHLGIFLLIYQKYKEMNTKILVSLFVIFLTIWFVELFNNGNKEINIFIISLVFLKATIVALIMNYLLGLYSVKKAQHKRTPFFYIALAYLIHSVVTVKTDMPEYNSISPLWQTILRTTDAVAIVTSYSLFSIGLWRTKEWVLKNPTPLNDVV